MIPLFTSEASIGLLYSNGVSLGLFNVSALPLISIVDDDKWARGGLEDLVTSLGYRFNSFESAEQFIASGAAESASCLITDLHMPGLSGLDLQSWLRREGYRTPVIFVTAYPNEKHRSRAIEAGALGFLTKPYDERSVIDCIKQAIPG